MWNFTTWVLYMCSSFWLLEVESRDFSQAEKEKTASKAEQIHKMATIFTPNDNLGPFWEKTVVSFVNLQSFCKQFFLSQHEKNHVSQLPTA